MTMTNEIQASRRSRLGWLAVGIATVPFGAMLAVVVYSWTYGLAGDAGDNFKFTPPSDSFVLRTHLNWPPSAELIYADDSHCGLQNEGVLCIVFQTDCKILNRWLSMNPPWNTDEWKRGPVPNEIASSCGFGSSTIRRFIGGTTEYVGPSQFKALVEATTLRFVARERCCANLRWHNGDLLAMDLESGRVWFFSWNY